MHAANWLCPGFHTLFAYNSLTNGPTWSIFGM